VRDRDWPAGSYAAEFADAIALVAAVRSLRGRGYARVETYSPMPLPELDETLAYRRSRLPALVFAGGVVGGAISYFIQWYANVYAYPLNLGGRPVHAVTAFIIPTFEGTILGAALTAFFGLWLVLRLPTYWHPVFELPGFDRVSVDRYWVAVSGDDPRGGVEVTPNELRAVGAIRVLALERLDASVAGSVARASTEGAP
jgi:hypothetical protein